MVHAKLHGARSTPWAAFRGITGPPHRGKPTAMRTTRAAEGQGSVASRSF